MTFVGEDGVDEGGLTKEFITVLLRELVQTGDKEEHVSLGPQNTEEERALHGTMSTGAPTLPTESKMSRASYV